MNSIGIKLIVFAGVFICSCYVLVASQLDKNGYPVAIDKEGETLFNFKQALYI